MTSFYDGRKWMYIDCSNQSSKDLGCTGRDTSYVLTHLMIQLHNLSGNHDVCSLGREVLWGCYKA